METINMKSGDYAQAYAIGNESSILKGELGLEIKKSLFECLELICSDAINNETEGAGYYKGIIGAGYCIERLLSAGLQLPEKIEKKCRKTADQIYKKALSIGMTRSISLLNGTPGLLVHSTLYGGDNKIAELLSLSRDVLKSDSSECELLYGRAGYLHSLLLVKDSVPSHMLNRYRDVLTKIVRQIGEEGTSTAMKYKSKTSQNHQLTLMYEWHGKMYYGGAHGIVGILYILMQCPEDIILAACPMLKHRITSTVNELVELVSNSVYPSSLGSSSKGRLCQFCHGATGFTLLFSKMFQLTRNRLYLDAASQAGLHVVHNTKTKGVGLCHGMSGNIYALLSLYRVSGDIQWLQFSLHMTLVVCNDCFRIYQHSDRPLSLYEGLPAFVCLVTDLLCNPSNAKFPGFDT